MLTGSQSGTYGSATQAGEGFERQYTCDLSDSDSILSCRLQVNVVRANSSCQGQLQLGCFRKALCVDVSRVEGRGDDNIRLWQILVKITVSSLL